MPTRNISLTKQQDAFIAQVVKSGEYQNASEAIRAAIRALQDHKLEQAAKRKALRAAIKVGLQASAKGNVTRVEAGELGSYLESLTRSPRKPHR